MIEERPERPERPLRCFLLAFSPTSLSHDGIRDFIDSRKEIPYWATYIRNTFFLISSQTAEELTDLLLSFTEKNGRFIILDTNTEINGWMPREIWGLVLNPTQHEKYRLKK